MKSSFGMTANSAASIKIFTMASTNDQLLQAAYMGLVSTLLQKLVKRFSIHARTDAQCFSDKGDGWHDVNVILSEDIHNNSC